jgi:SAM-dependent methyltransferase
MSRLPGFLRSGRLPIGPYRINWSVGRSAKTEQAAESRAPIGPGPYKLHFGPGPNWSRPEDCWLTIDVDPDRGDIAADFNRGGLLPLADNSCTAIYGSHIFEHMSIFITPTVFQECHRVLTIGGIFRLVLPDARKSIEEYLRGNTQFGLFSRRRQRAAEAWGISDYTIFECLREDFLSRSGQIALLGNNALAHQNAWDFETISRDLERAGFPSDRIVRSSFASSQCADFDWEGTFPSEARESDRSLYVEAVKG